MQEAFWNSSYAEATPSFVSGGRPYRTEARAFQLYNSDIAVAMREEDYAKKQNKKEKDTRIQGDKGEMSSMCMPIGCQFVQNQSFWKKRYSKNTTRGEPHVSVKCGAPTPTPAPAPAPGAFETSRMPKRRIVLGNLVHSLSLVFQPRLNPPRETLPYSFKYYGQPFYKGYVWETKV